MIYPLTFHPHDPGERIITSRAIPGKTVVLVREPATDETSGYWVSSVRDEHGECLAAPNMVELAELSVHELAARG